MVKDMNTKYTRTAEKQTGNKSKLPNVTHKGRKEAPPPLTKKDSVVKAIKGPNSKLPGKVPGKALGKVAKAAHKGRW